MIVVVAPLWNTSRQSVAGGDSATFSLSMHRYSLLTVMTVGGEVDLDSAHLLIELAAEALRPGVPFGVLVVDLSRLVSKWIGETEKNLAAVFDAAQVMAYFRIDDQPAGGRPGR